MSQMQALLSVLHTNDGDELILETDSAPQFMRKGQAIKLYLRAIPADRHQHMVGELLDGDQLGELADTGKITVPFDAGKPGRFKAHVRGPKGERIRFVKIGEEKAEPEDPGATAAAPMAGAAPVYVAAPDAPRPLPDTRIEPSEELQQLLRYAAEQRASDLHLATGEAATIRTDGALVSLGSHHQDVDALMRGTLDQADRARLAAGGSIDRAVQLDSGERFRMNVYRHSEGIAAAFRVLRPAAPPLSKLKIPVDLSWITQLSNGLVLFCGPTGSGKSTTMAALVQKMLAERGGLLITLEDPIEYTFEAPSGSLVRQRELGRHVQSFPTGLADALREDPDYLLVGEMRDEASIQLALTAAETGHLVLASLHSRAAHTAVERIVDTYPPERQRQVRVQLADALRGVVSQRLLPRAGGSGRIPAVEVLKVNHAASAIIRDGKTPQLVSVMQTGMSEGMVTMERCIRELVDTGRVRAVDAKRVTEG